MPTSRHPGEPGIGFNMPSKRYDVFPGVEILFSRTHTVELTLPSGRILKTDDEAPPILIVSHGDSTSYFAKVGTAWQPVAVESVGEIVEELDNADESARAPKF